MLRRKAMTLMELLVVVGLVGVLIGLVIPALAAARQAAGSAVCGSNLRQLAAVNGAYAHDHGQRFVPGAAHFSRNLHRWHGTRDAVTRPFDPRRGPLAAYLDLAGEVKRCPQFPTRGDRISPRNFEAGCGGYGYNNEFVGRDQRANYDAAVGAAVDVFLEPARTVMFLDAAIAQRAGSDPETYEYSFAEPPIWSWGTRSDPVVHFRHAGHANVTWLDGHVDGQEMSFSRDNIYGVTEGENRQLGLGGFGPEDNGLYDRD